MSTPDLSADAADALPVDLVEVGVYRTFAEGSHHGLVVLAIGRPYWLVPQGDAFQLLVESSVAAAAREQLARLDRESLGWPPPLFVPRPTLARADFITPLVWVWMATLMFLAQDRWPALVPMGRMDASAVFARHEYWRSFTALFLHGDFAHLASNLLGGFLVFAAVVSTLGRARGWLGLAAASSLGNLMSAWLHYPAAYHSLGASTAVFAGVGLLTGHALRSIARHPGRVRWRALFVPGATGFIVLGLYGADAVASHVDVGAHTAGLLAGVIAGFALPVARRH
jgi:membrane associated rhomboid family serine protease